MALRGHLSSLFLFMGNGPREAPDSEERKTFVSAWLRKSNELFSTLSLSILAIFHIAIIIFNFPKYLHKGFDAFSWWMSVLSLSIIATRVLMRSPKILDPLWFFIPVLMGTMIGQGSRIYAAALSLTSLQGLPVAEHMMYVMITALFLALAPSHRLLPSLILGTMAIFILQIAWKPIEEAKSILHASTIFFAVGIIFHLFLFSKMRQIAEREFQSRMLLESMEKQQLDRDLAIAKLIQESLTSSSEEFTDKLDMKVFQRKDSQVGGDWAALRQDDKGAIYALVADAAGKGIQAALVIHAVQSLWAESLVDPQFDPELWLKRVNRALCQLGIQNPHMVTVGLAKFSYNTCTYWSAGHVPLYLMDGSDSGSHSVKVLLAPGTPLGLIEDVTLGVTHLDHRPNFDAFLGSDGFFKAGSRQRKSEIALLRAKLKAGNDAFDSELTGGDDQTLIWISGKAIA